MPRMIFTEPKSEYVGLPSVVDQLKPMELVGAMWLEISSASFIIPGRVYAKAKKRIRRVRFERREEVAALLLGGMSAMDVAAKTGATYKNVYNVLYKLRMDNKL